MDQIYRDSIRFAREDDEKERRKLEKEIMDLRRKVAKLEEDIEWIKDIIRDRNLNRD